MPTKTSELVDYLREAGRLDDRRQAWRDCKRGDWMLWLIGRHVMSPPWSDGRKLFLLCALACAETVKPAKHNRTISASVGTLKKWAKGKATVDQAMEARRRLYASVAADAAAYAERHRPPVLSPATDPQAEGVASMNRAATLAEIDQERATLLEPAARRDIYRRRRPLFSLFMPFAK